MNRSRLVNILLVLLILLATLFLAQMLWQLVSGYGDVALLFILGWLVSFILNPFVVRLSAPPARLSRGAAVAIVYLSLVLAIVLLGAFVAPAVVSQLSALARHMPEYAAHVPPITDWLQNQLNRLGARVNVEDAVRTVVSSLQSYAATIVQNALGIFTSVLGFLANLFVVLILSFYFTQDGMRLRDLALSLVPNNFRDEFQFFATSVNRTFGGFILGQALQAFAIGVGTGIAMAAWQLEFALVASLFAGFFMLIPLVGPFLALLPPLLVALIQAPGVALWLLLVLFVYQFVVVNIAMPRVFSNALGMHPLLVLAALLLGVKIAGFWGAFFGIPVVGVLWAMFTYFFDRWRNGQAARTQ